MPTSRRSLLAMLLAAPLLAMAAGSKPLSPADAAAVRAVVRSQLDAFAQDDADRAFSFAANGIREMFGTADNFMRMVRGSYPMVMRPAAVTFLAPRRADGEVLLAVQLTDAGGRLWLALYSLQAQPGSGWRIAGCQVIANDGRAT